MSQIHIEYSDVIDARPEEVYAILADFHIAHPAILPKPYFEELIVEEGGQGAGTVHRLRMNIFGVKRHYHMVVTEPEPGRVLVETDEEAGVITFTTVDPINGGRQTRVTIASQFRASPGFAGFMEKLVNPPITRRIYKKELQMLADYIRAAN